MAKITYVQQDGTKETLDVEDGTTVMQAAIDNGVDGIEAACGGLAMCATCHVYVDEAFASTLPERSDEEDEMLDSAAADRKDNSRLSCQLEVDDSLDGLVVQIPDTQ